MFLKLGVTAGFLLLLIIFEMFMPVSTQALILLSVTLAAFVGMLVAIVVTAIKKSKSKVKAIKVQDSGNYTAGVTLTRIFGVTLMVLAAYILLAAIINGGANAARVCRYADDMRKMGDNDIPGKFIIWLRSFTNGFIDSTYYLKVKLGLFMNDGNPYEPFSIWEISRSFPFLIWVIANASIFMAGMLTYNASNRINSTAKSATMAAVSSVGILVAGVVFFSLLMVFYVNIHTSFRHMDSLINNLKNLSADSKKYEILCITNDSKSNYFTFFDLNYYYLNYRGGRGFYRNFAEVCAIPYSVIAILSVVTVIGTLIYHKATHTPFIADGNKTAPEAAAKVCVVLGSLAIAYVCGIIAGISVLVAIIFIKKVFNKAAAGERFKLNPKLCWIIGGACAGAAILLAIIAGITKKELFLYYPLAAAAVVFFCMAFTKLHGKIATVLTDITVDNEWESTAVGGYRSRERVTAVQRMKGARRIPRHEATKATSVNNTSNKSARVEESIAALIDSVTQETN